MAAASKDLRGRRAGLSRQRVIDAAVALIDTEGPDAFSVRKLAASLGVDPMSLYNHVDNKDDILDGVVEDFFSQLALVEHLDVPWEEGIRRNARSFRSVALAHPNVAVIALTRRVLTDVPLRTLRAAIAPALRQGAGTEDALDVLRTFTAFLTGAVLRELGSGPTLGVTEDSERRRARVDELAHSDDVLAPAAEAIATIDHERLFEHGVDLLIAGLTVTYAVPPDGADTPRPHDRSRKDD